MRSASNRFQLAFAITAGWDTRLILAASKEISQDIYYFTFLHKADSPDITVPRKLLRRFGLTHNTIIYPSDMDAEFDKIYKRNVTTAHDWWGRMTQALYDLYPANRVCIKGNAAEITRVRFRVPKEEPITGKSLARFTSFQYGHELEANPFVLRFWEEWLADLETTYNIHILDLFYWEHWAGNFAAMTQSEADIAQEVFTPYNCRRLLMNMLAVDEKHRDHDVPILYRDIVFNLWPELLTEPVNPGPSGWPGMSRRALFTKKVLMSAHLYQFLPAWVRRCGKYL